jgi:flavin-dependent dehydrogenase
MEHLIYDVAVLGGGLAGLAAALDLARRGQRVVVFEKKQYPFHRVCGEYVSNETRPYLRALGLEVEMLGVAEITRFQFSSPAGRVLETDLDLGGFGLSRYRFDFALYELAMAAGVEFRLGKTVEAVHPLPPEGGASNKYPFQGAGGITTTDGTETTARVVLGTFGKRSTLDAALNRTFLRQRSPYVGVKYHLRADFPTDLIALHNFPEGYCGISAIEDGRYCLCYLTSRANVRRHGSIEAMERAVLYRNPHLRRLFTESEFLYERPEVINEISFAPKPSVENGILMVGDAAGLITPLCGNGMAMALHGAKIAAGLTHAFLRGESSRTDLEDRYRRAWRDQFARRLWVGRTVQRLFGDERLSEWAIRAFGRAPFLLRQVVRQTHGMPF